MNPQDSLETVLRVKAGSHLYNLATDSSDEDHRGCVICKHPSVIFGFHKFEQLEYSDRDEILWNLPKFIKLALEGNTVALEVIWSPKSMVTHSNSFGDFLQANKTKFLSNHTYSVLRGYGIGELRRALGETTGKLGAKRKEEIEKFGYSPKNASHCLRLLMVGESLFKRGEYVTSWGKHTRDFLMSFKLGVRSREEFKVAFADAMWKMEKAFGKSCLPDEPDTDYIVGCTVEYMKNLL